MIKLFCDFFGHYDSKTTLIIKELFLGKVYVWHATTRQSFLRWSGMHQMLDIRLKLVCVCHIEGFCYFPFTYYLTLAFSEQGSRIKIQSYSRNAWGATIFYLLWTACVLFLRLVQGSVNFFCRNKWSQYCFPSAIKVCVKYKHGRFSV